MLTPGLSPLQRNNDTYRTLITGGFETTEPALTPALTPYTEVKADQAASLRELFPWSATKLQVSSSKKTNDLFLSHFPSLRSGRQDPHHNLTPLTRTTGKFAARIPDAGDQANSSDQAVVCRDLRDELILTPMRQLSLKDSTEDSTKEAKISEEEESQNRDVEQLQESQTPVKEIAAETELSVNFDDIRSYLQYFNQWHPGALLSFPKEERMDFKVWMTVFASQLQEKENEFKKDSAAGLEPDKIKRIALEQLAKDKKLLSDIEQTLKDPKLKGYFDNQDH